MTKIAFVFTSSVIVISCLGCSQESDPNEIPDSNNNMSNMTSDMFIDMRSDVVAQDMTPAEDMDDFRLDSSPDLMDMDEPDLLPPGRPCEADDQCVRGAVCDRDKCSVIVGCADTFDDPPPSLVGKGCLVTGFSESQYVAFECDSDDDCDDGNPCIMNACQDAERCDGSSSCPSMQICYAGVCVEER